MSDRPSPPHEIARCPFLIRLMIVCHYSPDPREEFGVGPWNRRCGQECRDWLLEQGLVTKDWQSTERGKAWVDAIVNTPLPTREVHEDAAARERMTAEEWAELIIEMCDDGKAYDSGEMGAGYYTRLKRKIATALRETAREEGKAEGAAEEKWRLTILRQNMAVHLVAEYISDPVYTAKICDEKIDQTGELLGYVRQAARMQAQGESGTEAELSRSAIRARSEGGGSDEG